jgi:phosphoribosylformimino-5-aminoimidazole carboxamide ribotide isomerase
MIIIPAIDLKNGQAVRLSQGRMEDATIYSGDPVEVARRWEEAGARRLHIVDLDGAVSGRPRNRELVKRICSAVSMQVELGGGLRDIETVEEYLAAGVTYAILGTAAVRDPSFRDACCRKHPGSIIIGIDASNGMVAVQGWTESTPLSAVELALQLDAQAVAAVVYTDISRDGMLTGPNIAETAKLAAAISIPVIASGGMSRIDDVKNLLHVESSGIMGVIIGRALYTGGIDLSEALALTKTN